MVASAHGRNGVAILVDNVDAAGGMERQALRLAREIRARGRPVAIVSTQRSGGARAPFYERRDGIEVLRVPFLGWWYYSTQRVLYELLVALFLARRRRRIATIYGVQAGTAGRHLARLGAVLGRPSVLKLACSGEVGDFCALAKEPDGARVVSELRAIDRIVCLNDESREEALAAGIAPERLVAIKNGIDLARFDAELARPLDAGAPPLDGETIVCVGRLDRQKRVHVLIDALARLAPKRPALRLVLLGEGPARAELEALARARGLVSDDGSRVVFAGVRKDVPAILARATLYVLASAHEGISNALLEAMAARAPCIATDIAGNRDLVLHEREGLLVPVDDEIALERAISRLLEDRALAARLGAAARARVERELTIELVCDRYLDLFDALPSPPAPRLARFRLFVAGSSAFIGLQAVRHVAWFVRHWTTRYSIHTWPRMAVTFLVVRAKRRLGIEGRILRGDRSI